MSAHLLLLLRYLLQVPWLPIFIVLVLRWHIRTFDRSSIESHRCFHIFTDASIWQLNDLSFWWQWLLHSKLLNLSVLGFLRFDNFNIRIWDLINFWWFESMDPLLRLRMYRRRDLRWLEERLSLDLVAVKLNPRNQRMLAVSDWSWLRPPQILVWRIMIFNQILILHNHLLSRVVNGFHRDCFLCLLLIFADVIVEMWLVFSVVCKILHLN